MDANDTLILPPLTNDIVYEIARDPGVYRGLLSFRSFLAHVNANGVRWWQRWCGLYYDDIEVDGGHYLWRSVYATFHDVWSGKIGPIKYDRFGDKISIFKCNGKLIVGINDAINTINGVVTLYEEYIDNVRGDDTAVKTKMSIEIKYGNVIYAVERNTEVLYDGEKCMARYTLVLYSRNVGSILTIGNHYDDYNTHIAGITREEWINTNLSSEDATRLLNMMNVDNNTADTLYRRTKYLRPILDIRAKMIECDKCDNRKFEIVECTVHKTYSFKHPDMSTSLCWGSVFGTQCQDNIIATVGYGDKFLLEYGITNVHDIPAWAYECIIGNIMRWQ